MAYRQIHDWRGYTREIQDRLMGGRVLLVRQSHPDRDASLVGKYTNASLAFRHAGMSADEVGVSCWVYLGEECVGRVYSGGEVVVP